MRLWRRRDGCRTAERIRDKIAAYKRKGLWMGGHVPLGYRVEDRKLRIDPDEAEQVRLIFAISRSRGLISDSRSGSNRSGGDADRRPTQGALSPAPNNHGSGCMQEAKIVHSRIKKFLYNYKVRNKMTDDLQKNQKILKMVYLDS